TNSSNLPFSYILRVPFTKIQPFAIQQLRKWWISKDYLTSDDTKLSSEKIEDLFERMVKDINN
ncbi:MAG: zeta toxin family protein, partial [Lentilactobacillus hilgardii]